MEFSGQPHVLVVLTPAGTASGTTCTGGLRGVMLVWMQWGREKKLFLPGIEHWSSSP